MSSDRSRASVNSQTAIQPLILAVTTRSSFGSTSSVARSNSTRSSKRDSAVNLATLGTRPTKPQRPKSDSEAMAPSYRLYPQQASNGRRESRFAENGQDEEGSPTTYHERTSTASRFSHTKHGSDYDEYPDERRTSLPSQVVTPENENPISPVVSEVDERNDSVADPRDVHRRATSEHRSSRIKYGYAASHDEQDMDARSHARSRSQQSSNTLRPGAHSQPRRPIPVRKPSGSRNYSRSGTPDTPVEQGYGYGDRSSAESLMSQETSATSIHTLPALQTKGPDNSDLQQLEPVLEDDPRSWDLVEPVDESGPTGMYAMEKRAEQLFSSEHLRTIFSDPKLLLKFTGFLNSHRPRSIAILIYYLDALKALRAINYANAIAEALDPIKGQDFTEQVAEPTRNIALEEKADRAFEILAMDDLPAFIAHTWTQVVSVSIQRRITGTLAPHLREASEGLAEVFCLTDPSRADNPIVFASEEFIRTTQYGMNYVIGRNCRFLQGPRTNPHSVRRLRDAVTSGREHSEVFINYRRDGSPFMNLLMTAPLMDSRGRVRYYIGAQVDVSNLVKECSNLDGLMRMVEKDEDPEGAAEEEEANKKDEFQELSEMFNSAELDSVRKYGGRMHKDYVDDIDNDRESIARGHRRVLLKDTTQEVLEKHNGHISNMPAEVKEKINGKLEGVYQHYLLIRPAPSLRILFTSPSLRVPGILQSPFLNRIGGSSRVRSDLRAALGEGRGVTAKIRWLTRADEDGEGEGRPRWIHCTPLFGHSGAVGVWMIVLVDEEGSAQNGSGRRFRAAPPVSDNIGGKQWDARAARDRERERERDRQRERESEREKDRRPPASYDPENERRGGRHDTFNRSDSNVSRPPKSYGVESERRGGKNDSLNRSNSNPARPSHSAHGGDVSEFSFQLK